MNWKIIWLLMTMALAGCQSGTFSKYISPQVAGRVLAADTRQPLDRATVRRVVPIMSTGEDTPPKGAQILIQPGGVRTDSDGRFVLEAESAIAWFHHAGWQSVAVSFECPGYVNLQTNFTAAGFKARTLEDVPYVNAGDIMLQPKPR